MRLILLRHEARDLSSCAFDSRLTEKGNHSATTVLKQQLQEYTKDSTKLVVFSSPFVRCLETILPYIRETKNTIDCDYSLMESLFPNSQGKYPSKYVDLHTPPLTRLYAELPESYKHVNQGYLSLMENSKSMCTTELELNQRLTNFLEKRVIPVFRLYNEPKSTILICTHQRVVQNMGPLIYKYFTQNTSNEDNEGDINYPMDNFTPEMGSFYVFDSTSSQIVEKVVPSECDPDHQQ